MMQLPANEATEPQSSTSVDEPEIKCKRISPQRNASNCGWDMTGLCVGTHVVNPTASDGARAMRTCDAIRIGSRVLILTDNLSAEASNRLVFIYFTF